MDKKTTSRIGAITASEVELNNLFKETLDGVRDDLNESQENVDMYLTAIVDQPSGGKELWGTLYNDALKIKGNARERQLKFLNMFKDRVAKKEEMSLRQEQGKKTESGEISHAEMNKFLQELKDESAATTTNIPKIDLLRKQEEEEDELDLDFEDEENDE